MRSDHPLLADARALATEHDVLALFMTLDVLPRLLPADDPAVVRGLWQVACSWAYRGLSVGDREFVRAVVREQLTLRSPSGKADLALRDGTWVRECLATFERHRLRWRILGEAYQCLFWFGMKGHGLDSLVDHIWHSRHMPEGGDERGWFRTTEEHVEAERRHLAAARTKRMTAQLDKRCGSLIEPGFMAWIGWAQHVRCRRTIPTCTIGAFEAMLSTRPGFMARVVPLGLASPPRSSRVYPLGLDAVLDMGSGVWMAEGSWVTRSHRHAPPTRGWMAWSYEPDGSGRIEFLVSGRTGEQALREFWARFRDVHGDTSPADRALAWCPDPPPEADDMSDEDMDALAGLAA